MTKPPSIDIGDEFPRNLGLGGIAELPNRMRELRPERIDEIAKSMKKVGLLNPIIVRPDKTRSMGYVLVAGRHRLRAALKLKWPSIKCFIRHLDDDAALLAEIEENLSRADLTDEERQAHLLKREELWKKRKAAEVSAHGCATTNPKGGRPKGFASENAAELGKSKSQVNRDLAKAKGKTPRPKKPKPPRQKWVHGDGNRCDPETGEPVKKVGEMSITPNSITLDLDPAPETGEVLKPKPTGTVVAAREHYLAELEELTPKQRTAELNLFTALARKFVAEPEEAETAQAASQSLETASTFPQDGGSESGLGDPTPENEQLNGEYPEMPSFLRRAS